MFFEFPEEASFSAAGEACEDDEFWVRRGDRFLEVCHEVFTPCFVAAADDTRPPPDGSEDNGHGVGAEIATPTVDERGEGVGVVG